MKKSYENYPEMLKDFFEFNHKECWQGTYANKSLTMDLDDNRLVVITLVTTGTHDHWTGFSVKIVHTQNGEIGRQLFPFAEYLLPDPKTINGVKTVSHLWHGIASRNLDWYGPTPTNESVMEMHEAMEEWIHHWK